MDNNYFLGGERDPNFEEERSNDQLHIQGEELAPTEAGPVDNCVAHFNSLEDHSISFNTHTIFKNIGDPSSAMGSLVASLSTPDGLSEAGKQFGQNLAMVSYSVESLINSMNIPNKLSEAGKQFGQNLAMASYSVESLINSMNIPNKLSETGKQFGQNLAMASYSVECKVIKPIENFANCTINNLRIGFGNFWSNIKNLSNPKVFEAEHIPDKKSNLNLSESILNNPGNLEGGIALIQEPKNTPNEKSNISLSESILNNPGSLEGGITLISHLECS